MNTKSWTDLRGKIVGPHPMAAAGGFSLAVTTRAFGVFAEILYNACRRHIVTLVVLRLMVVISIEVCRGSIGRASIGNRAPSSSRRESRSPGV